MRIMMVGDLILDEPDPDSFFQFSRDTLHTADLLVGHVEVPHCLNAREQSADIPAPASPPDRLAALTRAGFHVATLAGNHMMDAGPDGVETTVATLRAQGIATTGAGPNLSAAREPAVVERAGLRIGTLSYNCVGPKESWAGESTAGCAYVHVLTHYELDHATPGGPPTIYTFADPVSLAVMEADVEALRARVDIVIVALHKGIGHTPAALAMYERPVAKAAIDAGADIVIGHHSHILRGMEIYKGKPIYHGLGNFVTVTRALNLEENANEKRRAWAARRRELFGFEPDPDYPIYPFHPEAKNAVIAACDVNRGGVLRAGFLPCWIRPSGAPEVLGAEHPRASGVIDYVAQITRKAKLNAQFAVDESAVWFLQ